MKKTLSMLLAIVMVFSLLPISAFAAETGGKITFTTDFTNELGVGDTFTVTATLSENPGIASFANQLKWNEEVLQFKGFKKNNRNKVETEVFLYDGPVSDDNTATFTVATDYDNTDNGMLYIGMFEIIAEEGELGLGLTTTEFGQKFTFANVDGADIMPALDFAAITGLTVGGKAVGPEMPEDLVNLGVSAITTDNGAALDYTLMSDSLSIYGMYEWKDAPYYLVTIPQGAENVYVTFNTPLMCNDVQGEDWPSTIYGPVEELIPYEDEFVELNTSENGNTSCLPYYDKESNIVEIPMIMDVLDWNGNPSGDKFSVLRTDAEDYYDYGSYYEEDYAYYYHVIGLQSTGGDAPVIAFFAFTYAEEGEEEESFNITIDPNLVGGTLTACNENKEEITKAKAGDYVFVTVTPAEGYKGNSYTINGELANDIIFQMPEEDVILSATFTPIHTCSYTESVVDAKYLKSEATCQSGAVYYKSCECGKFATTADTFVSGEPVDCVYVDGICKWCRAAEPVLNPGYRFATSADVSAENGETATVHVKITGHSDENVTSYNAYDVTLTFDSEKLEYVGFDGAVKSDGGEVKVDGNTIRIVGCGTDKAFGTEIATLTFKTKAEGTAEVTVSKIQVSDKEDSVKEDAPEAVEDTDAVDETPSVSVIKVPYTVTKPGFISGNEKVLHGENYTFSYADTSNYTYSDLIVTVGGEEVTPTEENGTYTISNVTGAVKITATQTPNSYDVTKPENVTGPEQATYGEDYVFTVTPSEDDMAVDTVKVTLADGTEIPYTINENGEYVIEGTDITGEFTITVTEKEKMTTITFTGIEETEIDGSLTQTAEIGKEFTFKLYKEDDYAYTVKVGETELTETDGQYTIPAELVVKGGVQVVITKEDNSKPVVDVAQYINLDGQTMFLVTAKWKDKVLAYGENTMFWSDKYTVTGETEAGAYCWLVVSTDEMNTMDAVKAAAEAAIVEAAEGAAATEIKYDYDVNGTTKVDVNDAQLVYDMYNASYMEFSQNLPMQKFLEADMQTDSKLDTQDVAAIINFIINGANA